MDYRQIVRHKTFTTVVATVDEAILDLEALDYDFFLFADLASGQDAVVHRRPGGTYELQYLHGPPDGDTGPYTAAVDTDAQPAPEFSLKAACEHLDGGHEPRVFFEDAASGRGHVVYRRYDGHYGLITPARESVYQPPDVPGEAIPT